MTYDELIAAFAAFAAKLAFGPHGDAIKTAARELHVELTGELPADPAHQEAPEPAADTPEA